MLPMADRSAEVLVEAILTDTTSESVRLIAEQLALDPALVLWTVCRAGHRDPARPRSIRAVARWLRQHAIEVLQWGRKRDGPFDGSGTLEPEPYADQVVASLQLADLAALLAASDGQPLADEAYLLGLLRDADRWLSLASVGSSPPAPGSHADCLPDWLTGAERSPAAVPVARAVEILAGNPPAEPIDFDPEGCRRRAREGGRRWLEPVPGAGSRLPELTARLARLEELEHRFQEQLETEKLEALAEFAAGAGHEINNPLAIIGGRAQLLLREETDPERRRELALMNAQVKRAHEMIADMRLFARPPRPEPETFDLVALVDALVDDLAPRAAEQATSLSRTGDDGPLPIEADPAQLNVALRAMCKNSLEAIGHGGRIEIHVGGSDETVEIRLSDDGPGIEPEYRRHLFDPFYSARQAGRGLGFGLSKAWRIVTNHGGRIDVQSEPGQGATFTIKLPREAIQADVRPQPPPP